MKILFTNDPPVIAYGLAPGLVQIGVEVQTVPLWRHPWGNQREVLTKAVESFHPDFLFTEGDPPNFNRETVYSIASQYGIPVIYWAIQDPVWFQEISRYCAARSDYVFTTTIELLPEYRKLGKKAELLLFGCNPSFHKRLPPSPEYLYDLVFVGSNYPRRLEATRYMLEPLLRNQASLMVWGHWWQQEDALFQLPATNYGGLLPYNLLPLVYSSAKIVLGLHLDNNSITQTSVRTYEVLGCGAFYLTQYTPAHEHLFKRGTHLDWAENAEELLERSQYYLTHSLERERIAQTGQEYVYTHHTVAHRAQDLVEALRS